MTTPANPLFISESVKSLTTKSSYFETKLNAIESEVRILKFIIIIQCIFIGITISFI